MDLASYYRRQFSWRSWPALLGALPPLSGATVLDFGCGVGDLSAELAARGARVIGVDMNEEPLSAARSRNLPGVELHLADLRACPDLGVAADGLWSSFTAAYFVDLPAVLRGWARQLVPGGWIALTEIDDFFGHEPVADSTRALLTAYAEDALRAGRYDFHMGRKLADHLAKAGFTVIRTWTVPDLELSFAGPALPEVLAAWQTRFQHMQGLRDFCGREIGAVEADFLASLEHPEHRSLAKVSCCFARKTADAGS